MYIGTDVFFIVFVQIIAVCCVNAMIVRVCVEGKAWYVLMSITLPS